MSRCVTLVEFYQEMEPVKLADTLDGLDTQKSMLERRVSHLQSCIAAARKAQKNQKRAAKERKKVVG